MPIEIKELVIRTTIEAAGKSDMSGMDENILELIRDMKEDIVNDCAYKVFDQLRSNIER